MIEPYNFKTNSMNLMLGDMMENTFFKLFS